MTTPFGLLLPIASFLLVFIVVYAILKKTKILGDAEIVNLLISFIFAIFFIVEIQLVDFIALTTSWVTVIILLVFLFLILIAFLPSEKPFDFLIKATWLKWLIVITLIILFITTSSYIFHWTINWSFFEETGSNSWFSFLITMIIAIIVSVQLTRKAK